jgi:hypothetical protein
MEQVLDPKWFLTPKEIVAYLSNKKENIYDVYGRDISAQVDTINGVETLRLFYYHEHNMMLLLTPKGDGVWLLECWVSGLDLTDNAMVTLSLLARGQSYPSNYSLTIDPKDDQLPGTQEEDDFEDTIFAIVNNFKIREEDKLFYSRIKNITLDSRGGYLPYQAWGNWFGYSFYFRYRGGYAQLRVGTEEEDLVFEHHWNSGSEYGHYLDGSLTFNEFFQLFIKLGKILEPSSWHYTFPHKDASNKKTIFGIWADSYEEALEEKRKRDPENEYSDIPVAYDNRIYPEVHPDFVGSIENEVKK